jgi:hypothetical protein
MKIIKLSRLLLFLCCACVASKPDIQAADTNMITKTYYAKGMTCAGCVFHVDKALDKDAKKINFSRKKLGVGMLDLTFKKEEYKEKETDCNVKNSIEGQTDYKLYFDQDYKRPVC